MTAVDNLMREAREIVHGAMLQVAKLTKDKWKFPV